MSTANAGLLSRWSPRKFLWLVASMCTLAFADIAGAQAVTRAADAAANEIGRIRGVVFDSLLMKPVARAAVLLVGTARTSIADDNGNFAFDNVPAGAQTLSFSSALFDSLGLGTLGSTVAVFPNQTAHATIATPSLHTMWTYRCQGSTAASSDSGIVWGTIRDAATDSTVRVGVAQFSWYDLKPGVTNFARTKRQAVANDQGLYFACGLPTEISITTNALGARTLRENNAGNNTDSSTTFAAAASGEVEYSLGARRLRRLNLLVSADMVIPDSMTMTTSADSAAANRVSGRATVRGVVRDDKQQPLANAIVTITSGDTSVRTNADGRFQLGHLPGGTHMIQVRRVGSAPATQMVDLRPDRVADVSINVSTTTALATVNVRAKSAQRLAFEQRRAENFGFVIDSTVLNNRADLFSALSNHAGMQVSQQGSSTLISVRGLFSGYCVPEVFLDGLPSNMKFVTALPPDYFRTVEVLIGKPAPDPYFSGQCGVVLFWSKNIRW